MNEAWGNVVSKADSEDDDFTERQWSDLRNIKSSYDVTR